jgi:hypothetical protein
MIKIYKEMQVQKNLLSYSSILGLFITLFLNECGDSG